MEAILVVNAGSSSLKFQIFAAAGGGASMCAITAGQSVESTRPIAKASGDRG